MELTTILNQQNVVEIKGYEELKETVEKAIVDTKRTEPIANDFELDDVKLDRTRIRKAKEIIGTFRKETYKQYLSEFEEKCKALEEELDIADKELKEYVDAYTNKEKKITYVITIKTDDKKLSDEIEKFVNEKGLTAKVEVK